jgi:acetylornithine deacetylase
MTVVVSDRTRERVESLLIELIRFPSTRGQEGPAIRYLSEQMAPWVDSCTLAPIDDAIIQDPDYAFPLPGHTYRDTPNLECLIRGKAHGPTIVFNTHLDVVPPSENQTGAFLPRRAEGKIFGRGACDAKGQAAVLFALALLLRERGVQAAGDILFHFVIEEENGGNGTLAMIRRGVRADAAVVIEPTEMAVVPAVRGAMWFELQTFGRAAHSGSPGRRISALDKALEAMNILRDYHDRLLAESHGLPLFDIFADPMPLTFGECKAGTWPATVPAKALVRGVFGFLPNRTRAQVRNGMIESIRTEGDEWLREHFELTFPMLHSEGNMLPVDHPLVKSLLGAVRKNGLKEKISAMTASCDAWLYNNQARIPTVVFGPGSIAHAHSAQEEIVLEDILTGASVLVDFVTAAPDTNLGRG